MRIPSFGQIIKRLSKMSLAAWVSLTIFIAFVSITFITTLKNIEMLKLSKARDAWAIMYLELEKMSDDLKVNLGFVTQSAKSDPRLSAPNFSLRTNSEGQGEWYLTRGLARKLLLESEVGTESFAKDRDNYIRLDGVTYLAQRTGSALVLYPIDARWLRGVDPQSAESLVYIMNRSGSVLYSSETLTSDFLARPLVQHFVLDVLSEGQLRFKHEGQEKIGFYREIKGTNLVLFKEVSLKFMQNQIYLLVKEILLYAAIVIFISLFLIQIPLGYFLRPLATLKSWTQAVTAGRFATSIADKGFGELHDLAVAFENMGQSLAIRDSKIQAFMRTEHDALRLKNQMAITTSIQENLLPKLSVDAKTSGVDIAAFYVSAEESGGDWYFTTYDERCQETVVVIADVSGHGVGSAMFTAIIAAFFEYYREHTEKTFPGREFFEELNRIIRQLGKGKWHVTGQIVVFSKLDHSLKIYNAGHQPPILYHPNVSKPFQAIIMPGSVLGTEDTVFISERSLKLEANDLVLMYTDGLLENKNQKGEHLTLKKLGKILDNVAEHEVAMVVDNVRNQWSHQVAGSRLEDDTCLVSFKVVA